MAVNIWRDRQQTILICIDSYQHGTLQGRFYNPISNEGQSFENLTQFITKMEQSLDSMDSPKAYTVTRTFAPPAEKPATSSDVAYQKGKLASFAIRILFRQNASRQGSIVWLDNNQEQSFRSVLELILMFDNALTQKQAS